MPATTMTPHVAAALSSTIGAIPGCSLNHRIRGGGTTGMNPVTITHTLRVSGWSPSLHEITMDWPIGIHAAASPADQMAAALAQIERLLAEQRRRSETALAMGIAFPLEISSMHPTDIGHLHADASLIAVLIGSRTSDAARAYDAAPALSPIAHLVQRLHYESGSYRGGGTMHREECGVLERPGIHVVEFDATIHHPTEHRTSGIATIAGSSIRLDDVTLPQTLVDALPGRPLGDLAHLGPLLDNRRIKSVRQRALGVTATLHPIHVRLGDIGAMKLGEAQDHLAGLVAR